MMTLPPLPKYALTPTSIQDSKLVIAVDLHDVVADWVGGVIDVHGWPERMTGRVWDWYDDGWSQEEWIKWFQSPSYAPFLERLAPIYEAADGLLALANRHSVFILTAAPSNGPGYLATYNWLYRSGKLPLAITPERIPLIAVDGHSGKIEYLKKHAHLIDWVIDDFPDTLEACAEAGVNAARFYAPWNAHLASTVTVRNWKQIKRFFLGGQPFWPDHGPARISHLNSIFEDAGR